MKDTIHTFIRYLVAERQFSPQTAMAYRSDLKQLLSFLQPDHQSWCEVAREDLTQYISHIRQRGLAPSTIEHRLSTFRSFFRFLTTQGLVDANPVPPPTPHRIPRTIPEALSPQEIQTLAKEGSLHALRDAAILQLLYPTSMGPNQIVALDLNHLDLNTGCLVHPDQRSPVRTIPLQAPALDALKQYLDRGRSRMVAHPNWEKALFLNAYGHRLTRQGLWLMVKRYTTAAGLGSNVTPRLLRKLAARSAARPVHPCKP